MTNEIDQELDRLRRELADLGVAGAARPEDHGLVFRDASSFFEPAGSGQIQSPVPSNSRQRPRLVRWLPPSVLAAAAASLLLVVLVQQAEGPTAPSVPVPTVSPQIRTVAQVLGEAAESSAQAEDQSGVAYWRVETLQQQGDQPEERRTVWLGHARPGLLVDEYGQVPLPPATFGLQRTVLSWDELVALPQDAAELIDLFRREAQGLRNPDIQVAKMAAGLLAESPAPPGLRRALWQVIAELPGVRSLGTRTDATGRAGIAIALGRPTTGTVEYIIDPARGTILQSTVVPERAGADVGRFTYLEQGPSSALPAE